VPTRKPPENGKSITSAPEIPLWPLDRSPGRIIYRAQVAMRSELGIVSRRTVTSFRGSSLSLSPGTLFSVRESRQIGESIA
jgi:hypothetical protein